jgi:hypothetical protein
VLKDGNLLADTYSAVQGQEINSNYLLNHTSLKAYYRFESGALTTDTKSNHPLTAVGTPTETTGKFGGGVALASVSSQAYSISDHSDLKPTGAFTIGAWIKTSTTGANQNIFQSYNNSPSDIGIQLRVSNTNVVTFIINATPISSTTTVTDGNWHYILATYDGTTMRIYIDGVLASSGASSAPTFNATNYPMIGCRKYGATTDIFFNGSIDEVFLLNGTALSATEVSYFYNKGGYDLRFTSDESGNIELPYEVVSFDKDANTCEIHVLYPNLYGSTDTTVYVWGGYASATAYDDSEVFGKYSVWDENYKGLWHLQEASGTRIDSTRNGNNLTDNNTVTQGTGKIGYGADFESSNSEFLSVNDNSSIDITGSLHASMWINFESLPASGGFMTLFGKYVDSTQYSYAVRFRNDSGVHKLQILTSGNGSSLTLANISTGTLTTGVNYKLDIVITPSTSTVEAFLNGSSLGTESASASLFNSTSPLRLGQDNNTRYLDGIIDEFRLVSTNFTADRITLEYNNQNDPEAFAVAIAIGGSGTFFLF